MKLFTSFFICIICWVTPVNAQLDSILWIDLPCALYPGSTFLATTNTVPGATYYEWTYGGNHINGAWFNGSVGAYQSSLPSVNISIQISSPYYVFCVTAYGPAGSSNTYCDSVSGNPIPVFTVTNPTVVNPSTIEFYSVDTTDCQPSGYEWTITGDATFSNGSQTVSTTIPGVNISFGPGFTSGILCASMTNFFGWPGDTICMTITSPLGVSHPDKNFFTVNYTSSMNLLDVQLNNDIQKPLDILVYDITGRKFLESSIEAPKRGTKYSFALPEISPGIYFVSFSSTGDPVSVQRFVVTR